MRKKYKILKKPDNWEEVVNAYQEALNRNVNESELIVAARTISWYFPVSNSWKSGRIQLIRNLKQNVWIDIKYEPLLS